MFQPTPNPKNHATNRQLAAERCVKILMDAGYTDSRALVESEWLIVEEAAGLSTKKTHPEVRSLALAMLRVARELGERGAA